MEYTTVKNLKWADEEKNSVFCDVDFADLPEEFVPFRASQNDVEPHGREIFARCVAGDFGPIATFEE